MDDLTVCRLSAEALGYKPTLAPGGKDIVWRNAPDEMLTIWNPLANAEQRWECVEWLLKRGNFSFSSDLISQHSFITFDRAPDSVFINCPASEFPARAVAELQRRKRV